ncbi:hypothetical protein A5727_12555 [Mycobacterium sp. ACS4331]|nr:hypothetical protein A5727_12555 [Mycobacterium sp. ACS4331]
MCWMCDHPDASDEDVLDEVRMRIGAHGWAIQYIESDRAPYAYTVGLHAFGLPELLVTGLDPQRAGWLLNRLARQARVQGMHEAGAQLRLPSGTKVEFVDIPHPHAHLNVAIAIGGPTIRARQVVWADDRGRWPWGPGFDGGCVAQPVLGPRELKAS